MITSLTMYYFKQGLGDTQAAEQFSAAFNRYISANNPGWGDVVIAAGIHGGVFAPHKGDINLYWYWSGSDRDDWLEHYISQATVKPDAILCTSRKMYDYVRGKKLKAIYLPIGTGPEFFPLTPAVPRLGTGYCGTSGNHKPGEQQAIIIDPARRYGFEWRTHIPGGRPELNEWYGRLAVCLGMTAEITLSWGIVPSRTYEVLAGANPYVTTKHWAMNDEIGFDYPWQSGSAAETVEMIEELTNRYEYHKAEFEVYASLMRRWHTWDRRVEMLKEGLEKL